MHTGELIELAAIVTARAPLFFQSECGLAPEMVAQYWSASKCRQQRWAQALKRLADPASHEADASTDDANGPQPETDAYSTVAEILASEVLTRVWTAIVTLDDRRRKTADAEPVARSVLLGHLEARRRALTLLVRGPFVGLPAGDALNRLRRRSERWNDMLIGYLHVHGDVAEFAFDADVAGEFARDFRGEQGWRQGGVAWSIVFASLRAETRALSAAASGNQALNDKIAAAIVGALGYDAFDSLGLPRSLWTTRMQSTADSARGWIEQLLSADAADVRRQAAFRRR
ncbi:MAG TPA: hypothetical protein VHC22_05605 [Pirellulales bacterium]|nr:hypothetical protein [Pirellulales bacterium]